MAKASTLRTTAAVVAATIVVLAVVAGLGNQGLASWRATQAGGSDQWLAVLFQPFRLIAWRISPQSGPNSTNLWLAPLVFNGAFVILTILLTTLLARGRGPGSTLVSVWSAVTTAGGLAGLVCTPLAFTGSSLPTAQQYSTDLGFGLLAGFIIGFVAGVVAAIASAPESARVRNTARTQTAVGSEPVAPSGSQHLSETWPQGGQSA
jgi:hypothetical protein